MQEGISLPEIEKVNEEGNSASFVISPLYPGYGVTVGNSLRRVLYSSLKGAAIYALEVQNASHEFSTLPGVKEDLIQIILNLKQVRLIIHEGEDAVLKLKIKGPKEVTAADISASASVEIVNPKQPIASLSKTGKLDMELKVNRGMGYVPTEIKENREFPIGTISIDAIYSPIKKVNFDVEPIRVGEMTNYDKLMLDITTDGTIKPTEALTKAAAILIDHFNLIKNYQEKAVAKKGKAKAEADKNKKLAANKTDFKSQKIEEAGFSNRTTNALLNNKVKTIAGLSRLSLETIREMKGMGAKGFEEIQEKLTEWGLIK